MTGKRGSKPPLVAEKRTRAAPVKRKPAKQPRRKKAAPKRRGLLGTLLLPFKWLFVLLWRIFWRGAIVVTLLVGIGVFYYASTLPPMDELVDGRVRGSVTLQDAYGETFAWRGDQFGGVITSDQISPNLRNAIVATEDKRFDKFYHFGVDFYATAAAMVRNFRNGGNPLSGAGGSSITQQTAKLLCFGRPFDPNTWEDETAYEADCRRTTLWRKVQEAVYAFAMEARYTKAEILTVYVNRAYLGAGSRGFEAASQRYFGISASQVNVPQAAMLAGLLKAPSSFAPTRNLQVSQDRGATVVRLMQEAGYLTEDQITHQSDGMEFMTDAESGDAIPYSLEKDLLAEPQKIEDEPAAPKIHQQVRNFTRAAFAEDASVASPSPYKGGDTLLELSLDKLKEVLRSQGLADDGTEEELRERLRMQVNTLLQQGSL